MKYQITATVLSMLFLLSLISNASYGAIFTMKYPSSWLLEEYANGYGVTSPDQRFSVHYIMIPAESVYSIYSTTNVNQIPNQLVSDILKQSETTRRGSSQLIQAPTLINGDPNHPVFSATFFTGGFFNILYVCDCGPTLNIVRYIGYPDSITSYIRDYKWIADSVQVVNSKLPQAQLPQPPAQGNQFSGTSEAMWDATMESIQRGNEIISQNTDNYLEGLAEQDRLEQQREHEAEVKDPFDDCINYSPTNSDC